MAGTGAEGVRDRGGGEAACMDTLLLAREVELPVGVEVAGREQGAQPEHRLGAAERPASA